MNTQVHHLSTTKATGMDWLAKHVAWAVAQFKSDPMQYIGFAVGALGALVLGFNDEFSRNGWLLFFASNIILIVWSRRKGMYGVLAGQLVFTYTSLNGIAHSFF